MFIKVYISALPSFPPFPWSFGSRTNILDLIKAAHQEPSGLSVQGVACSAIVTTHLYANKIQVCSLVVEEYLTNMA